MKTKATSITITEPCNANPDAMETVANGKFCTDCCKTVWDFTAWSEEELSHFFSNRNQSICGRFLALQLDRPLPIIPSGKYNRYIAATALGLSLLWTHDAAAQYKAPLKAQHHKAALQKKITKTPQVKTVKILGVVRDEQGNAVPSVPVQLSYRNETYNLENVTYASKVFSDKEGCFEMEIPKEVTNYKFAWLEVNTERFRHFEVNLAKIDLKQFFVVQLKSNEVIVVKSYYIQGGVSGVEREPTIDIYSPKAVPNPVYDSKDIEQRGGINEILKDIH